MTQRREWRLYVEDILDAIARARTYVAATDFETFSADPQASDAVLYNFAVVGEAVGLIPPEVRDNHPEVPWAKMRGMRNVVIHQYPDVDLRIVWDTVHQDLPPLEPLLPALLSEPR